MRSFQTIIAFLFALLASVMAAEVESYDATVYITSTVFRVNTVTMSGPSSAAANQTSTIHAPSVYATPTAVYGSNGTAVKPTGSATKPATPEFTGAATSLKMSAVVAGLAAAVGLFAL